MSEWIAIARVEECPPGNMLERVAGDRIVALANVDGTFYAIDGVCAHQGGPLGEGKLTGCIVTCPWHGWQFDMTTGCNQLNSRIALPRFEVQVENDQVLVRAVG